MAGLFSTLPDFKGKGRIVLLVDKLLTNTADPVSYTVIGKINGESLFEFDLRPWGQKFAFYYRQWEKDYVALLKLFYSGGTFIDIGSSLGLYVVGLAEAVRQQGAEIISIEPVPFNLKRQKRNLELNGIGDEVSFLTHALGAAAGTARIRTDPTMADNNALIASEGDMEIQVARLDDLLGARPGRIGMIKMDVEGYEPAVIEGAVKTLQEHRPVMLAEFNRERIAINQFSMQESWNFLVREIGYEAYWLDAATAHLRSLSEPGDIENIFFLPPEVARQKLGKNRGDVALRSIS